MLRGDDIPELDAIHEDDEFKIKYIGHTMFFGDTEMKFHALDISTNKRYSVQLTQHIRLQRNSWFITETEAVVKWEP
jgi:hypothetical protein